MRASIARSGLTIQELRELFHGIYRRANRYTEGLLVLMFLFGLFLAFFYDTWLVAVGIGGSCVVAYYATKKLLPDSTLSQYVLSAVSAIMAGQYIYQMHGMAEMHFWVFISSTVLIIYQNWRLQIPLITIVVVHHATFAYLQYIGYNEIYFTQLAYMDLTAFIFHGVLASGVCLISGVWSYNTARRTVLDAANIKALTQLKAEMQLSVEHTSELNRDLQNKNEELQASEEELLAASEELKQINENLNAQVAYRTQAILDQNQKIMHHAFVNAHEVRGPLARILGLVNLMKLEEGSAANAELLNRLNESANELDDILREVRHNLDQAEYRELETWEESEEIPGKD